MSAILITTIAAICSGILYRMGGAEGYDTKWRDIGVPSVIVGQLIFSGIICQWWIFALIGLMSFAALTTYWDIIFGKDNFCMHGFFCGMGMIPLQFCCVNLFWIILRSVVLAVLFGMMGEILKKIKVKPGREDVFEEFMRGALISATVPLLFL